MADFGEYSTIKEMCEFVIDCPHFTPEWTDQGYIVVRNQNIRHGRLDLSAPSYTHQVDFNRRVRRAKPKSGDIIITREAPMGEVCLVPENLECCLGQRQVLLRPKPDVDPKYLHIALQSPEVRHQIMWNEGTGSTVSNIRIPVLEAIKIPRFGEAESAIAAVLSALDDKIELNQRMNVTLEASARSMFQDWFSSFGPTRAKMEGQIAYLTPDLWSLFPDRLDRQGIPEGWGLEPLTEIFDIIGGGTPKTSVEEYWNGDIPWFSVVDTPAIGSVYVMSTEKSITKAGLATSSAKLIPEGTTIISARGTVGNLAIAGCDMTFNQSCYALTGKGAVGSAFVFLAAQNMVTTFKTMSHGSVFSTITRGTFESIRQPKPTPDLLVAFEAVASCLFDLLKENAVESRTLSETRNLLLPKLMSGEIRVRHAEKLAGEHL